MGSFGRIEVFGERLPDRRGSALAIYESFPYLSEDQSGREAAPAAKNRRIKITPEKYL